MKISYMVESNIDKTKYAQPIKILYINICI